MCAIIKLHLVSIHSLVASRRHWKMQDEVWGTTAGTIVPRIKEIISERVISKVARRAFKGLGLRAIIESPRSRFSYLAGRYREISGGRWDKNRYVSRKGKWGVREVRTDVSANGRRPSLKYDRARPVKNILSGNIRARNRAKGPRTSARIPLTRQNSRGSAREDVGCVSIFLSYLFDLSSPLFRAATHTRANWNQGIKFGTIRFRKIDWSIKTMGNTLRREIENFIGKKKLRRFVLL